MLPRLEAPSPRPSTRLARLRLPRVTRAHLALQERPAGARQGHALLAAVCESLAADLKLAVDAEARLVPGVRVPAACLAQRGAFVLVELAEVDAHAVLEAELPFLVALLERLAGARSAEAPVTELTRIEEATFGYVLLGVLAAARETEGLPARLGGRLLGLTLDRDAVLARLEGTAPHLCVEVTLCAGGLTGRLRLLLPAAALRAGCEALPVETPGTLAPALLSAGVPLRCRLGRSPLSLVELMRLDPGDVVTFAGTRLAPEGVQGPGRLLAHAFELTGDLTPGGFTVSGAHPRTRTPEVPVSAVPDVSEPTQLSAPLPVEVEVEFTRVLLPLAELARIQPGGLLPLRVSAGEPVVLRVGDRAVARAELVDIEGEVGARILSLLP